MNDNPDDANEFKVFLIELIEFINKSHEQSPVLSHSLIINALLFSTGLLIGILDINIEDNIDLIVEKLNLGKKGVKHVNLIVKERDNNI